MKKIIISKDFKLIQAMKKLASTGLRCLIVVDKKKKLLGTLTDGDIRRAIINGTKLTQNVEKIYNSKPNFLVKGSYSLSAAKNLLSCSEYKTLYCRLFKLGKGIWKRKN